MKIVIALYYYLPYISGLSIYARRLAESLVARRHQVVIITSQHDRALEREETESGVRIRRVPVWLRLDKGALMPGFVPAILREGRDADVINLHLPMAEAALVALAEPGKTVITYHCDVRLNQRGPMGRLVERAIFGLMRLAVARARVAVTQTLDYAAATRVLHRFLDRVVVIPPPVPLAPQAALNGLGADYFRHRAQVPRGARTIGFVGRIVYEKGIDFLIHAFYDLVKHHDDVYLLIAGDYRDVMGGSVKSTLMRFLAGRDERIRFLGRLSDDELDGFYRFIDVLALPSIDPLEAYGMVQVEAMLRGKPVVSTDLPGVRTIVRRTGMGEIVPRRDPHALAVALERILYRPAFVTCSPEEVVRLLDLGDTTQMYEQLFAKIARGEEV